MISSIPNNAKCKTCKLVKPSERFIKYRSHYTNTKGEQSTTFYLCTKCKDCQKEERSKTILKCSGCGVECLGKYVCNACYRERYGSRYVKNYQKSDKGKMAFKRSTTKYKQTLHELKLDRIKWEHEQAYKKIVEFYKKALWVNFPDLFILCDIYDTLGGPEIMINNVTFGVQMNLMWEYVREKFLKQYPDFEENLNNRKIITVQ